MAGSFDWNPYVVGGAARPDTFSGLDQNFQSSLAQLFTNAPPEIQQQLRVTSGFRSPERQAQLYQEAVQKYGSPAAARKWVAPPGRSQHNHGSAADLKFLNDAARQWAHQNAKQYGLAFPMAHEPWHVEPIGARGRNHVDQAGTPQSATASVGPSMSALPQPAAILGDIAAPAGGSAKGPQPDQMGQIAAMFLQNAQGREQQKATEQAAEDQRRAALLDTSGLWGMYA